MFNSKSISSARDSFGGNDGVVLSSDGSASHGKLALKIGSPSESFMRAVNKVSSDSVKGPVGYYVTNQYGVTRFMPAAIFERYEHRLEDFGIRKVVPKTSLWYTEEQAHALATHGSYENQLSKRLRGEV
jgi:hypothetical protein